MATDLIFVKSILPSDNCGVPTEIKIKSQDFMSLNFEDIFNFFFSPICNNFSNFGSMNGGILFYIFLIFSIFESIPTMLMFLEPNTAANDNPTNPNPIIPIFII